MIVKLVDIFDDNKSSDIFLYNIVTHLDDKIYTIFQCCSSKYDTNAIFAWLYFWLLKGACRPREVCVDCSYALLDAVYLAFNGCYYKEYLMRCFNIVHDPLPYCLIKRDRAHLIKAASEWICFRR